MLHFKNKEDDVQLFGKKYESWTDLFIAEPCTFCFFVLISTVKNLAMVPSIVTINALQIAAFSLGAVDFLLKEDTRYILEDEVQGEKDQRNIQNYSISEEDYKRGLEEVKTAFAEVVKPDWLKVIENTQQRGDLTMAANDIPQSLDEDMTTATLMGDNPSE